MTNSGFHARKNPRQHLKVVIFGDASFSKKHIYVCDHAAKITLNRPSSAWESFNIWQKRCLFVLGITQISNLPTVCIKLMWVGGPSTLMLRFDTRKKIAWIKANLLKTLLILLKAKNLNWLHHDHVTLKV